MLVNHRGGRWMAIEEEGRVLLHIDSWKPSPEPFATMGRVASGCCLQDSGHRRGAAAHQRLDDCKKFAGIAVVPPSARGGTS